MDYYADIRDKIQEPFSARLNRIINGVVSFVLAYLIVASLYQLIIGLTAAATGFDVTISFHHVSFPKDYKLWSMLKVFVVNASAPFALLGFSLICIFLYVKTRENRNPFNLLMLWLFIHSINYFLCEGFIMVFGVENYYSEFYRGFSVIAAWYRIPQIFTYFLILPLLISLAIIGVFMVEPFLAYSYSSRLVHNYYGKRSYFMDMTWYPILIGSPLVLAISFPEDIFIHIIYLMGVMIMMVAAYIRLDTHTSVKVFRYKTLQSIFLPAIIILFILILIIRLTWNNRWVI